MRILTLNGASGAAGAAFGLVSLRNGGTLELLHAELVAGRDGAERLPAILAARLEVCGWSADGLDLLAVVVGPGSFTGLRGSLALAHGLALGGAAELVGVTVGEALAPVLRKAADNAACWCVSQARRDRVFIERILPSGEVAEAVALELGPELLALPTPLQHDRERDALLLGGDAAALLASRLDGEGGHVRLLDAPAPDAMAIAAAALARRSGMLPPRPAQPLYVDPPEAKLPAAARSPAV